MNIFITGASGFIGKAFLKKLKPLLAGGDRAFCLSRRPPQEPAGNITWLTGDLGNAETFRAELLAADYVVHIGGEPNLSAGKDKALLNYTSTRELLSALKGSPRIKKFIYVSSISAAGRRPGPITGPLELRDDGPPGSAYGGSKRKAEELLVSSGLPFTILRPAFVYGEGMRPQSHINKFVSLVLCGSPLAFFNFPGKLSLIHVDDLAAALAGALTASSGNRTYFAETETKTAGEIFSIIISALTGKPRRQFAVPLLNNLPGPFRELMPAGAAALLSDSFWAKDASFAAELLKESSPKLIEASIWDVIRSNPDFILKQGKAA